MDFDLVVVQVVICRPEARSPCILRLFTFRALAAQCLFHGGCSIYAKDSSGVPFWIAGNQAKSVRKPVLSRSLGTLDVTSYSEVLGALEASPVGVVMCRPPLSLCSSSNFSYQVALVLV